MLLIEQLPDPTSPELLIGKERDTLVMTSEERRWARRRVRTSAGRAIALACATGTTLEPGAIIAIEATWYLQVEAAAESGARDAFNTAIAMLAVRIAFEIGNHHFPLAIDGADLLVPDDSAMRQLLDRLGQS